MKMLKYIVICAWLFALLDWKVIELTRFQNREWLDWMHAHEREYAAITRTAELILCTPAMALKPLFSEAMLNVEASKEAQDAVVHAPKMSLQGFYHLPVRGQSWTFVSWTSWFSYWAAPSLIWWMMARKYDKRTR